MNLAAVLQAMIELHAEKRPKAARALAKAVSNKQKAGKKKPRGDRK